MKHKRPYTLFRDFPYFDSDGYHVFHGIPVKQEYDAWNNIYWYSFRNKTDVYRLNGKLILGF